MTIYIWQKKKTNGPSSDVSPHCHTIIGVCSINFGVGGFIEFNCEDSERQVCTCTADLLLNQKHSFSVRGGGGGCLSAQRKKVFFVY